MKLNKLVIALVFTFSAIVWAEPPAPPVFSNSLTAVEQDKLTLSDVLNVMDNDQVKGRELLIRLAEKGNSEAQKFLGDSYFAGTYGLEQDTKKAFDWWENAAQDPHNTDAMQKLADVYRYGNEVVPANTVLALEWSKKVADASDYAQEAMLFVGKAYLDGVVVEKDPKQAVFYLEKSAKNGNSEASALLGKIYEDGILVTKDEKKAFEYYENVDTSTLYHDSGEVNYRKAQMLEEGRGTEKNFIAAFEAYFNVFNFSSEPFKDKAKDRLTQLLPTLIDEAEKGNYTYKLMLADLYEQGGIVPKDYLKADSLYREIYQQADNMFDSSDAFARLDALRKRISDINRPVKIIEATEQDKAELLKVDGLLEQNQYDKACYTLVPLAEKGIAQAQYQLGSLYMSEQCKSEDDDSLKRAFHLISSAARQQNIEAQLTLGQMYKEGLGTTEDWWYSAAWYNKAAEKGNSEAAYRLAGYYADGIGVQIDANLAIKFYEIAIKDGKIEAFNDLGTLYDGDHFDMPDYAKAREYYLKGAELNDSLAMNNIAVLYMNGNGVEQDYRMAKMWLEKAADMQEPYALYNLGLLYQNGWGVAEDQKKAYELFEMAANLDQADAAWNMALAYEQGTIVKKDLDKAIYYYQIARDSNVELVSIPAAEKLKQLRSSDWKK